MRKYTKILILTGIALALGLYVFIFEVGRDKRKTRRTHIFTFKIKDVTTIGIQRHSRENPGVRIQRQIETAEKKGEMKKGRWKITWPGDYAADQIEVAEFLFQMQKMKIVRTIRIQDMPRRKDIPGEEKSPKEKAKAEKPKPAIQQFFDDMMPYIIDKYYGFAAVPPYYGLRLDIMHGKTHEIVFVGDTSPAGGFYVIRYPTQKIYLVKGPKVEMLKTGLFHFRDKRLIRADRVEAVAIESHTKTNPGRWQLIRLRTGQNAGAWHFQGKPASTTLSNSLISTIRDLRANAFLPPYGKVLPKPELIINYRDGDENTSHTITLYPASAKHAYHGISTALKEHFILSRYAFRDIFEIIDKFSEKEKLTR